MMRHVLLAALSAVMAAGLVASDADAGQRKKRQFRFYDTYRIGPVYIPGPRFYGFYTDPDEEDMAALEGQDQGFDDDYYEPKVKAPAPPPAAKTKTVTPKAKPAVDAAAAKSAGTLTCDKATGVVAGFGFTDVKPAKCDGQVYAFTATRDGKAFAIKLNSASGELTEVRKVQ